MSTRQKFRQQTRKYRRALVVGVGLGSIVSASLHAEEPYALAVAEMVAPAMSQDKATDFDSAFAILPEASTEVSVQPGAVDIAAIEPATGTPLGGGMASYYGKRFHGKRTASGEAFDMNAMTAAHKTLPFGSRLRVTNPRTGQSVVVTVNDRGPYARNRVLDVSRAAAQQLGLIGPGHAQVELELLDS